MPGFEYVNALLFAILAVAALTIAQTRSLLAATMLFGLFSLTSASIFVLLDAVDVAFTEAAVGAGMTTVLFLAALAHTHKSERADPHPGRHWPALLIAISAGGVLAYAGLDLPPFANPQGPIHQHPVTERYLVESEKEIGLPNVVTSVLASYRGYDTLGEVVVIFTAGIAVLVLLGRNRRRREDE